MPTRIYEHIDSPFGRKVIRILDSYASLLALLLLNFFMLELIDDPRWGAIVSTLLGAVALVIAISDPEAGEQRQPQAGDPDRRLRAARADRAAHELGGGARARLPAAGRAARVRDAADHARCACCATGA